MNRINITDDLRLDDGTLPAYEWPGGYPIFYLASDSGLLCPKCANEYTPERDNEKQLKPVLYDVNFEDDYLFCEHCNTRIESAYGTPNEVSE